MIWDELWMKNAHELWLFETWFYWLKWWGYDLFYVKMELE